MGLSGNSPQTDFLASSTISFVLVLWHWSLKGLPSNLGAMGALVGGVFVDHLRLLAYHLNLVSVSDLDLDPNSGLGRGLGGCFGFGGSCFIERLVPIATLRWSGLREALLSRLRCTWS